MTDWICGRVARVQAWNDTHFSVHIDCDHPPFIAGQFVRVGLDVEGERITRPYSCVNAPDQPGVEILFNRVPDGLLSGRLAALRPGDSVWVSDRANGFLTLNEIPAEARDLWMLATGTGIGPFLSILRADEAWQRFESLTLAHGVRHLRDRVYTDLLEELAARQPKRLRVIHCVTAEQPPSGFHGRITEALQSGALEHMAGQYIDPAHSHFLLCGQPAMIQEASALLNARGLKKHLRREPGQISSEKYQ